MRNGALNLLKTGGIAREYAKDAEGRLGGASKTLSVL
jgi:hypothetical protein